MDLNITKDLYIFFALLLVALSLVGVQNLIKIATKNCKKLTVGVIAFIVGLGASLAVFGILFWLDDGKIRLIYPLLTAVEYYGVAKLVDWLKRTVCKKNKRSRIKKSDMQKED